MRALFKPDYIYVHNLHEAPVSERVIQMFVQCYKGTKLSTLAKVIEKEQGNFGMFRLIN
jgi:hypothetical protein